MNFAEVAVNSPGGGRSTFSYAIPSRLPAIAEGSAVWVPFGPRVLQGIVVQLTDYPSVEQTREIISVIGNEPILSHAHVSLALWMSRYYLCPIFEAVSLMLPPGFERKTATIFEAATPPPESETSLNDEEKLLLEHVRESHAIPLEKLERRFGRAKARRLSQRLIALGFLHKKTLLEKGRSGPKTIVHVELLVTPVEASETAARIGGRAVRQAEILTYLSAAKTRVPLAQLRRDLSISQASLEALSQRGLIHLAAVPMRRDPISGIISEPTLPHTLTPLQDAVWRQMERTLASGVGGSLLLFGVTGSGKTELYFRALTEVRARKKRALCLVPEIALTPQTIERFMSRFPGRVGVFHSGLTPGEQYDEWQEIRNGAYDVVIGPRSALFVPQPDLGLIIVDEEHEWTYKQQEKPPRYHTREVAAQLAKLTGCTLILGSATPDIETYYRSETGQYQRLELPDRITPGGQTAMPEVQVVDMNGELRKGNTGVISQPLHDRMSEALSRGEQTILFLNRRGSATFVQCRTCGFALRCPRCNVGLTYHAARRKLLCHHCRYVANVPVRCPQCSGNKFRFLGIGTEGIEQEVARLFPDARLLRWDRDTAKRNSHDRLLAAFRNGKADVLIGTQMIAKGLHLPEITLAGIINADSSLNMPDFRAGERTFQLLCQVAGRAGRGLSAGQVIIQTYSPDHYAVKAASRHDYVTFYNREIEYRRQLGYPPFSRLVRLVYSHTNAAACQAEAERVGTAIAAEQARQGVTGTSIVGPVPAFNPRLKGRYFWQLIVRGPEPSRLIAAMDFPRGWTIDVDPVGLV